MNPSANTLSARNAEALRLTLAMASAMRNPGQIQKNLKISEEEAETVRNLFKILLTSSGDDEHFKRLEFGINQRRLSIETLLAKEDGSGTLTGGLSTDVFVLFHSPPLP